MVMAAHPSSAVELRVEDASGAPGEEITIAVLINDEGDTLSAGFTLSYDRQILTATGAETTSLTSGFMVAHAIKWEHITVALAGDTALMGGKEVLVNVTFSVSENASEGKTTITLSNPTVYGADYQAKEVNAFDGHVTISEMTSTTTTTRVNRPCPVAVIYGEHSEKTAFLRYLRDNLLNQTSEGQELIRIYYHWSPLIAKVMEEDQEFKKDMKDTIDHVLPLIRGVE
jgi:hypothetical protein